MVDYSLIGLIVVMLGVVILFVAMTVSSRRARETGEKSEETKTEVRGAGVILIGPVPIIFGTDTKWVIVAVVLAIILLLLGIVATWGIMPR